MTSKHWGVATVALVLLTAACQQPPQFTAADEAAIKAEFDSVPVWFKAKKFDLWVASFADDAYLQPPNGKTATGHAALLAWANTLPPLDELSFGNEMVSGDGNMAYGSTSYVLKPTGAPPDTGKQLVVLRRGADGKWKVTAVSFNSDLPLPQPAPTPATKAPPKK